MKFVFCIQIDGSSFLDIRDIKQELMDSVIPETVIVTNDLADKLISPRDTVHPPVSSYLS